MKRGIEVWADDENGWCVLHITKARGSLTLEDIRETAREFSQDIYMLMIRAFDEEEPLFDLAKQPGDHVKLYLAEDCFHKKEAKG